MSRLITGEKTPEQIQAMRDGGKILAGIFADLRNYVEPDMTKKDIDKWVGEQIIDRGAEPTYRTPEVGFDGNICISVNDEIVHGLPNDMVIERGDLVSFDLVITYQGMKTDSAFTMMVDEQPKGSIKHLMKFTEQSLYAGIDAIKGPVYTGDIGYAIESVLKKGKLGIIRDIVGHGVGLKMHMPPEIPNYGHKGRGILLKPGDTIAIEPMATLGGEKILSDSDGSGWTIATYDGSLSAHFEHTILVTENGAEILTIL
ncbi:type I methionyl aminopeptidase [Candidatus Saccharibacteria bacterium]|nr:MAG: type I methionyl aminopeptidase [Candidatus Saccharibacteria bacterium]